MVLLGLSMEAFAITKGIPTVADDAEQSGLSRNCTMRPRLTYSAAYLARIHRWSLGDRGASEGSDALWPGTMCLAKDYINPAERASDKCEHPMI